MWPSALDISLCPKIQKNDSSHLSSRGFITERQRLNLNPAYLDYLTQKNKKRNHKPRRVSDAEWAKVKAKIKENS